MKSVKPPQFLSDLGSDLRDRHLLLPVIGLLIALIAVPMLLKSSDEPPPPAPAVAPVGGAESAVTPAVLADASVSVRNYRKRLADLKRQNPFKPQFPAPVAPAFDDGTGEGSGSGTAELEPAGPAAIESIQEDIPEVAGETDPAEVEETPDETTGGTGNGGNGGNNEPSTEDVEVVEHLVTRRVDLTIGVVGDPKLRENVKPMTILPDETTPVLAFLGTDEKGLRAAFVLSKDATVINGDGACVPTPENCLYITLEKNETASLAYGPDGQTFNLRLLAIEDHQVSAD